MSAPAAPRRGVWARWACDLAMGARLSVAGGRSGKTRLTMISLGIGLGVVMLLLAATIPTVMAARDARSAARTAVAVRDLPRGADTLLLADIHTEYRGQGIYARMMQPEGERAPLPPGVSRWPGPGELVVSPALARLLASNEGALLRGRWGERVVGTIGPAGLLSPGEYALYLGSDRLTDRDAQRIQVFGEQQPDDPVDLTLMLLSVVGLVVLLLPVAIFVATAVRFGGETRDRQLAALRLVGADAAMTRRIAAGETLAGALLGLVTGGLLYVAAGLLAGRFGAAGTEFYPADFRPVPALVAMVILLVPVAAVFVTLSALRQVVVEPLGVVRRSGDRRRRLWWRLILPAAGLALLYPLRNGLAGQSEGVVYQVMAGVTALLVGMALLLPWAVEVTVRRLGGGGVAWQLAVRRLQLDNGTAVRAVSGIAVSVAGVIALQGLLAAVQAQHTVDTGRSTDRFQVTVVPGQETSDGRWATALADAPGVRAVDTATRMVATPAGPAGGEGSFAFVQVGTCAVLRELGRLDACTDGDTFVVAASGAVAPPPGTGYDLGGSEEPGRKPRWTLPATARTVPAIDDSATTPFTTILATPAALSGTRLPAERGTDYYIALDRADPDALDRLRNAAARVDPSADLTVIEPQVVTPALVAIRRGLLIGAVALLALIGASLLLNVVEQLRERRRLLAVLVAFGTRHSTLSGSVLYQIAIPVLLGLALAVVTGTALATVLQAATKAPIRFDWSGIGATSGAAALVVLLATAASLPLLRRLTRPTGLRSE